MGIRNCTALLLLLFLSHTVSQAQNVAGLWLGVTYGSTTGLPLYDYTMTLTQTGNRLNGSTQAANAAMPFGVQAILSGQLNGSTVAFTESNQDGSVNGSCYWRGTMTYDSVNESLTGSYENIDNGTYCAVAQNGKIELYRIVLKSGSTFCKNTPARLTITGKNIRWYSSASKTNLLATGNTYTPRLSETTTVYITQTLNQVESPAVPITVTITEPIYKAMVVNAGCNKNNGSIQVIAAEATDWQYSLNNAAFQASPLFATLSPGSYTVVAKDVAGCQAAQTATIVAEAAPIISSLQTTPPVCTSANGEISILAVGGKAPLLYSADDGVTFQASPVFSKLAGGAYTVRVRDAGGCEASKAVTLSAASAGPQFGAIQTTSSTCGDQNGTIRITPNASTTNVAFSIDGQPFQKSSDFVGLKAGTYALIIKDGNNCITTRSIQVSLNCAPVIHLPTAFSPNNDFVNDALTIYFAFSSLSITTFIVYDRWGTVLYNRANFALSSGEPLWDGQLNGRAVPAGMYTYRLDCQFPDGTPMTYRQSVALLY